MNLAQADSSNKASAAAEKERAAEIEKLITLTNELTNARINAMKSAEGSDNQKHWQNEAEAAQRAVNAYK